MSASSEPSEDHAENGRVVVLTTSELVVPSGCACCGDVASSSRLEVSRGGASLIVPYCGRCLRHASARTTRALAAAVASCLIAISTALALPLAWSSAGLVPLVLVAVAGAAVPLAVRWLVPRRPRSGHTAIERAVWWLSDTELACTSARWAASLSEAHAKSEVRSARLTEPRFSRWLATGPLLALVASIFGWYLHHPLVRVLNLTESRIVVLLDGRPLTSVEPTSSESPAAGVDVRAPAGEHRLVAVGPDGAPVADAVVSLRSGSRHLYAPASGRYCFWLEETGYGRAGREAPRMEPLGAGTELWVLPRGIDSWFAPSPPPLAGDNRSSGGVLRALRQARCEHAPPAARR